MFRFIILLTAIEIWTITAELHSIISDGVTERNYKNGGSHRMHLDGFTSYGFKNDISASKTRSRSTDPLKSAAPSRTNKIANRNSPFSMRNKIRKILVPSITNKNPCSGTKRRGRIHGKGHKVRSWSIKHKVEKNTKGESHRRKRSKRSQIVKLVGFNSGLSPQKNRLGDSVEAPLANDYDSFYFLMSSDDTKHESHEETAPSPRPFQTEDSQTLLTTEFTSFKLVPTRKLDFEFVLKPPEMYAVTPNRPRPFQPVKLGQEPDGKNSKPFEGSTSGSLPGLKQPAFPNGQSQIIQITTESVNTNEPPASIQLQYTPTLAPFDSKYPFSGNEQAPVSVTNSPKMTPNTKFEYNNYYSTVDRLSEQLQPSADAEILNLYNSIHQIKESTNLKPVKETPVKYPTDKVETVTPLRVISTESKNTRMPRVQDFKNIVQHKATGNNQVVEHRLPVQIDVSKDLTGTETQTNSDQFNFQAHTTENLWRVCEAHSSVEKCTSEDYLLPIANSSYSEAETQSPVLAQSAKTGFVRKPNRTESPSFGSRYPFNDSVYDSIRVHLMPAEIKNKNGLPKGTRLRSYALMVIEPVLRPGVDAETVGLDQVRRRAFDLIKNDIVRNRR